MEGVDHLERVDADLVARAASMFNQPVRLVVCTEQVDGKVVQVVFVPNGLQYVMFTHHDTSVWSHLVGSVPDKIKNRREPTDFDRRYTATMTSPDKTGETALLLCCDDGLDGADDDGVVGIDGLWRAG